MRTEHIRNSDLNLLIVFMVLVEETTISRAARRLHLSQPAVSRALQRLRDMFDDPLFVRGSKGYELTSHGTRVLRELEVVLPRLDSLLRGSPFDPDRDTTSFRIVGSDYSCYLFAPALAQRLPDGGRIGFEFTPWSDQVHEDIEHGRVDISFHTDDGVIPNHFKSEYLYEETLTCVVSTKHPIKEKMTLLDYTEAKHVVVNLRAAAQTIPDRPLAALGLTRHSHLRVPYFGAAMQTVVGTDLVATIPLRLARLQIQGRRDLRLVEAPIEVRGYRYMMIWHPRLDADAAHLWLRQQIRDVANGLR